MGIWWAKITKVLLGQWIKPCSGSGLGSGSNKWYQSSGPRVVMSLTMTFGRDRSGSDNPGDIGTVDLCRGLISSMTQKIHQVYMTFSPRQSNNINNPNI